MIKLILFAATFVVLAAPAHAGFVPAAVAWVSATFAVTAATAAAVLNFAASMAFGAINQALQKRKMGRAGGANVTQTVEMGDDLPLSFVVGEYATAGKRKYMGSWGRNTRFITEVIEISCLPQGLDGIWVNDERGVWANDRRWTIQPTFEPPSSVRDNIEHDTVFSGWLDVGRPLSNLSDDGNRIYVKVVDGTQTEADPFLVWVFGNDPDYPWTSDHIGIGKSYVIITTRYDSDSLTQYPTFLFEPTPLPLYDWRRDSTAGGVGPHRWGNASTYEPTRNPVVIGYNVARGIYCGDEWVFGGKNLAAWRLPTDEMTAAANAADQPIGVVGGGTEPRYRCGLEISVDMEPASVLEELGTAANMTFAEVGGRLKVVVDLPGAAVFHFTDADILTTEGQSFNPFYPAAETYNAISATYPERREKWTLKDAPEYIDAEARASDNGQPMTAEAKFGAVPFFRQVQRLMRTLMRSYRRMRRHQFHLPPDAYALEPGIDLVSWTSAANGYINKQFILERVSKQPGMNVLVRLRERDPSDYDWSSDYERPVVINTPVNPRPFVQPIRGLTAIGVALPDAAGNARRPAIQVACQGDEVGVTHIQIEARLAGASDIALDTERAFTAPFSWHLQNVLPMTTYQVHARLMSDLTPRSVWSEWLTVTTPDVRLGSNDLRMTEIQQEVREDLQDRWDWMDGTGDVLRRVDDEIAAIRDGAADGQFGALLARDELRREVAVEIGNQRASFEEQIDVIATEQLSAAIRTSTLRAQFNATTALVREEMIALAGPDSALAARIDTVEVALNGAEGSATQGLIARVDTIDGQLVTTGEAITQVTARTNRGTANGLLRISAESSPSGVQTTIGMRAEATANGATNSAAFFMRAFANGRSDVVFAADRFAIATGQDDNGPLSAEVPFAVDGGRVYIEDAYIRNAAIDTLRIKDGSVGVWWAANGPEITFTASYACRIIVLVAANIRGTSGGHAMTYRLYGNGDQMDVTTISVSPYTWTFTTFRVLNIPAGTHTFNFEFDNRQSSVGDERIAIWGAYR